MSCDKYGCCDDAEHEEEEVKKRDEVFENYPADMQEKVDKVREEESWKNLTSQYNIENYYDRLGEWEALGSDDKLKYCQSLLKSVEADSFPLQRQVFIFTNLVNLNILVHPIYQIMEAAFYNDSVIDSLDLKINFFIPKKHYKLYIDKIYADTNIQYLQIPIEDSTAYLQELLEIWYMYQGDLNPYEISNRLEPYDKVNYEKKQIERKLTAIRTLLQ